MPRKPTTMIGISTAGIHAPTVNFETTTIMAMMPVVTAPTRLIAMSRPPSRLTVAPVVDHHPDWLSVNPVNTPNA